jgi:hypothetical protein
MNIPLDRLRPPPEGAYWVQEMLPADCDDKFDVRKAPQRKRYTHSMVLPPNTIYVSARQMMNTRPQSITRLLLFFLPASLFRS